jgi:hypothetical protein
MPSRLCEAVNITPRVSIFLHEPNMEQMNCHPLRAKGMLQLFAEPTMGWIKRMIPDFL